MKRELVRCRIEACSAYRQSSSVSSVAAEGHDHLFLFRDEDGGMNGLRPHPGVIDMRSARGQSSSLEMAISQTRRAKKEAAEPILRSDGFKLAKENCSSLRGLTTIPM